jgi:hypothetical protein
LLLAHKPSGAAGYDTTGRHPPTCLHNYFRGDRPGRRYVKLGDEVVRTACRPVVPGLCFLSRQRRPDVRWESPWPALRRRSVPRRPAEPLRSCAVRGWTPAPRSMQRRPVRALMQATRPTAQPAPPAWGALMRSGQLPGPCAPRRWAETMGQTAPRTRPQAPSSRGSTSLPPSLFR